MSQTDFNSKLKTPNSEPQPVECLGLKFESDEARRAHFTELLRERLRDPDFRKIEGFPIGEDEDILNLSDPPYYTACPNPWIGDFIAHYGKPYDPKVPYHREPFAADVSEGKNHPIYNAHSYHTKVPHRAIMRYILHYTEPGDVVFDGFCGTGMTGVATQLCGDLKEVRELGYRVDADGTIYNEEGKAFSKLGARRAVLNDLSPLATFIAYNYNTPVDVDEFEKEAKRILSEVESECAWMYKTKHTDGSLGTINYVIWSDVYSCPECGAEVCFWDAAVDRSVANVRDTLKCDSCSFELNKRIAKRVTNILYDDILEKSYKLAKQVPVLIIYSVDGTKKRYEKEPDNEDIKLIENIAPSSLGIDPPHSELPDGFNTRQPMRSHGLTHTHYFYTKRNLIALGKIFSKTTNSHLKFLFTGFLGGANKLNQFHLKNYVFGGGGFNPGPRKGTLYAPSISMEVPAATLMRDRLKTQLRSFKSYRISKFNSPVTSTFSCDSVSSQSNTEILDYAFIDPPFGANLNYSELSFISEDWLRVKTNNKTEAIENTVQGKSSNYYRIKMVECFKEIYLLLKPGRWMTVEFSNTKSSVWNSIQSALLEAGFVVANVSALDKKQGGINSNISTTAVKQDLVISAYKPNGGLEKRFAKHGDSIEGVWDFLQTHLKNLPVVKPKGGQLERIAERDPRILYDRMVAFYIGHNTPVPLSSGEFQAAMHEKYPERDGMVFLAEQVAEYDAQAAKMEHVGQMSIFVEDEKSAINWIRQYLKDKPDTFQGIHPEFMQQLSASWKKFETRPELSLLLDQNFLKYNGEEAVPSQIHSYLSTNFKDLRGKEKDDPALKAKAKDRWYVPDPKKALDVEAVRNKRLRSEFWALCSEFGVKMPKQDGGQHAPNPEPKTQNSEPRTQNSKPKKLKEVRSEAIRYGFLECHRSKDAATILAIARILPENVIEEDEQLQMIVDMAEMRAE